MMRIFCTFRTTHVISSTFHLEEWTVVMRPDLR